MVILDALVLPVQFLVRIIERVSSAHLEYGRVPATSGPNQLHIRKPNTGLTDHQWVSGRRHRSFSHIRLEVVDRSADQVHIVAPSRDNRIRFSPSVTSLSEVV